MNTCFGIVCDRDGLASSEVLARGRTGPELRTRAWASPAAEVRREQASRIPIDWHHNGRELGQVVYLELDRHGRLWAVGHVEADPVVRVQVTRDRSVAVETELYWSAERRGTPDFRDLIIDSIALTPSPARLAAQPLRFLPGSLHERSRWTLNTFERGLLKRASEAFLRRRHNEPIRVHGQHDPDDLPPGIRGRGLRPNERLPGGLRRSGSRGAILDVG